MNNKQGKKFRSIILVFRHLCPTILLIVVSFSCPAIAGGSGAKELPLEEQIKSWRKDEDYRRWLDWRRVSIGSATNFSLNSRSSEKTRFASMYQAPTESDKQLQRKLEQTYIDYGPDSRSAIMLTWSVAKRYYRDGMYDKALPHLNFLLRQKNSPIVRKEVDIPIAQLMVNKCKLVLNQSNSLIAHSKDVIRILKLRIDYLMSKQGEPDLTTEQQDHIESQAYRLMKIQTDTRDQMIRAQEYERHLDWDLMKNNYTKAPDPRIGNSSVLFTRDNHGIYTRKKRRVRAPVKVPDTLKKLSPKFQKHKVEKTSQ